MSSVWLTGNPHRRDLEMNDTGADVIRVPRAREATLKPVSDESLVAMIAHIYGDGPAPNVTIVYDVYRRVDATWFKWEREEA